jgi:hypothetical protein
VSDKLPEHIVDQWPEILKDIEIKAVPIEYLKFVSVYFHDGEIWEIDVRQELLEDSETSLEEILEEFFDQHNEDIKKIDFQIDAPTMISDIKSRTKTFMKKRK